MGTEYIILKKENLEISVYEMSSMFTLYVQPTRPEVIGRVDENSVSNLSPKELRKMAEELVKAASYADGEPAEIKKLY